MWILKEKFGVFWVVNDSKEWARGLGAFLLMLWEVVAVISLGNALAGWHVNASLIVLSVATVALLAPMALLFRYPGRIVSRGVQEVLAVKPDPAGVVVTLIDAAGERHEVLTTPPHAERLARYLESGTAVA